MIIVSQDRDLIINFNQIEEIYVTDKYISVNFGLSNNEVLATYETEKRAKEVLQEIIERYTNWNNLVYGQPTGFCSPKYEMPEK